MTSVIYLIIFVVLLCAALILTLSGITKDATEDRFTIETTQDGKYKITDKIGMYTPMRRNTRTEAMITVGELLSKQNFIPENIEINKKECLDLFIKSTCKPPPKKL